MLVEPAFTGIHNLISSSLLVLWYIKSGNDEVYMRISGCVRKASAMDAVKFKIQLPPPSQSLLYFINVYNATIPAGTAKRPMPL